MDNLQKQIKEIQRQNRIIWGFNLFMLIQTLFVIMYIIFYC